MQLFKKIVLSVVMATASLSAAAEATGEAKVKAAVEGTIAKIEEAVNLAETGADSADISQSINAARQLQKEFRYEGTERSRQKANDKLRMAREAFEKGDKAAGQASLKEALTTFIEMKATYDASHRN
jgi:large subunit ribosomal protein L7/L12